MVMEDLFEEKVKMGNFQEESIASANPFYVWRKGVWQEFDTGSFSIGNRDAKLMVVRGDTLVSLEREQSLRIMRSGDGLIYVPLHTRKNDPEFACRRSKKPKKKINKLEPLLHELNAHMALMNKILIEQWTDRSKSNMKGNLENQIISETVKPLKNLADISVSADIHEKPATPQPTHSALSSSDVPIIRSSPKSNSEGKKRAFIVSPESLQAIGNFSQKHLDIMEYRGRTVVSPDTFDKDDDYCRMLLHKLNPVVKIKRSLIVDREIKKCQRALLETTGQKLPLTRFAATLGLVGAEKKQFMSDILEQRRHMRKIVQKVYPCLESDGFITDSSAADFELKRSDQNAKPNNKVETAKIKKTAPTRESKRFESGSSETSLAMPSSQGDTSDDKTKKLSSRKAKGDNNKENRKRRTITSDTSTTSDDDKEYGKKLPAVESKRTNKESKSLKQNRVLRSENSSKISERENIQLKSKRLGEVSFERSPPSPKMAAKIDKSEGSLISPDTSNKTRNYSRLEDQAIVDYIIKENNPTLIKGTLMWENLEKVFHSMTNQSRTSRSLKFRCLNYIMPNLKSYDLPNDKKKLLQKLFLATSNTTSDDDGQSGKKLNVARPKRTNAVSEPLKHNIVLRNVNPGKISECENIQHVDASGTSDSLGKSPLKRPDLKRVIEEDTSTTTAKQTKIKRLGDTSPEKSPPSPKKATKVNKTEGSQKVLSKANTSSNTSIKMRIYSMLEDQAILDYILKGNNSRLVKGTLMWKSLQKVFYSMTNQSRTWQSLKNRYLNYIMPDLKYYGLSYEKEKLLRTGLHLGEITRKRKTSKENSIFKTQPVASASNALRLRNKLKTMDRPNNDDTAPSTSKAAPGPATSTPMSEPRTRKPDPTYSELTRRFQQRHAHSSSSSDEDIFVKPTRKLYNTNSRRLGD